MGSAYQPGPSAGDIFLIAKKYLISLQKSGGYFEDKLKNLAEELASYRSKLSDKGLSREIEKLDLVTGYLSTLKAKMRNGSS